VNRTQKTRHRIAELLASQRLAVLSTHHHGQPYASLVGFAAEADLSRIYFATPETTRKYRNLREDPRASMLIDSRTHQESDFHRAAAVTAVGRAVDIEPGSAAASAKALYLSRHPYLADFLRAPTTRFIEVGVVRYLLVENFQEVMELRMQP
jgi:nitroimidazol reductase NimA-like FMN-containing flavoprotein (pyridoxamine 5'-phosphate oxidase superfamily)